MIFDCRQSTSAVFFDVDFTLIYPGPAFQGEGYRRFCAAHGIEVDPGRYDAAVRHALTALDAVQNHVYDHDVFVRYIGRIIEEMGGSGERLNECARYIYEEWADCQHFTLYDDVEPALRALSAAGLKIGLISNTIAACRRSSGISRSTRSSTARFPQPSTAT
jgi:FMN phosphatase YigB (HAD superfamily)